MSEWHTLPLGVSGPGTFHGRHSPPASPTERLCGLCSESGPGSCSPACSRLREGPRLGPAGSEGSPCVMPACFAWGSGDPGAPSVPPSQEAPGNPRDLGPCLPQTRPDWPSLLIPACGGAVWPQQGPRTGQGAATGLCCPLSPGNCVGRRHRAASERPFGLFLPRRPGSFVASRNPGPGDKVVAGPPPPPLQVEECVCDGGAPGQPPPHRLGADSSPSP